MFAELEEVLIKEGFNKRSFMGRVISFARSDHKRRIIISICLATECVEFTIKPEDPELDDTSVNVGLHLFCRLFKETKDLNSFFDTVENL